MQTRYSEEFKEQAIGRICAFLLILMFPSLSGALDEPDSLTIAISGWEPDNPEDPDDPNAIPGVFKLADCQAQGGGIEPLKIKLEIPGIEGSPVRRALRQGIDSIKSLFAPHKSAARKKLEQERISIIEKVQKFITLPSGEVDPNKKIHIVGHSWGCTLALKVAQDLAAEGIKIESLICIDLIDFLYPAGIRPRPIVPANVKTFFYVRQKWDLRPYLVGGSVKIKNRIKTNEVKNFNLRADPKDPTERDLLDRVLKEFKNKNNGSELEKGDLHTFLDDSHVIWRLAGSLVNRPCDISHATVKSVLARSDTKS